MVALVWVLTGGCCCCWGVGGVVGMLLGLDEPVVPLVEGPGRELAMFECCFDVIALPLAS